MSKNSDDKPLVKARHDNSVLFSLKDLDSGGSPKASEDQAGAAQNDSSGFINLNAIASSSQYVNSGEGQGGMDAVGVVPAMLPMGQKKDNKGVIIAVAVAGVLLVGVIVVLIVVLTRQPQQTTIIQQVAASTPSPAPAASAAVADKDDKDDQDDKDDKPEASPGGEGDKAPEGEEDKALEAKGGDKAPRANTNVKAPAEPGDGKAPAEPGTPEPPPDDEAPAEKPKPKPEGGSINDILDDLGGKKAPPVADKGGDKGETPAPGGGRELSRNAVKDTIGRYQSRVNACGGPGKSGSVLVRFTVQPNGSVGAATVTGDKAGSAEGNCVATAVRGFKFPEFDGSPKTITYPFSIP